MSNWIQVKLQGMNNMRTFGEPIRPCAHESGSVWSIPKQNLVQNVASVHMGMRFKCLGEHPVPVDPRESTVGHACKPMVEPVQLLKQALGGR